MCLQTAGEAHCVILNTFSNIQTIFCRCLVKGCPRWCPCPLFGCGRPCWCHMLFQRMSFLSSADVPVTDDLQVLFADVSYMVAHVGAPDHRSSHTPRRCPIGGCPRWCPGRLADCGCPCWCHLRFQQMYCFGRWIPSAAREFHGSPFLTWFLQMPDKWLPLLVPLSLR